jgi:superfamily II DNA or RNA helicase
MALCRVGYIVPDSKDVRKDLTVRPIILNNEFGFPPPPFKVYKVSKSGLCVPRFWAEEKFGPAAQDKRIEPARVPPSFTFTGTLRDSTFQNEALAKGVQAGHGVLSLPCGYGKTTVALALASHFKFRTMIIVHKEFLANQWSERIKQFCPGATIGRVQQDKLEIGCDFVIAMLQSLASKEYEANQFDSIGTVIVDEAHHICARVFSQALFRMCPRHIFGLSATPIRKDGLTPVLNWFMGPVFFAVEREHQKQVEVVTIAFDCKAFRDPPPTTRFGKLSLPTMITELCENESRNLILESTVRDIISNTSRQLLVLSDRRAHCQHLKSLFSDEVSGLYMGGMKEKALTESSTKRVIFATFSQAHEGLDIPSLDTVILATPKSDIKQSIGRIMRETTGKKNHPKIYDMIDHWSVMFAMFSKRKKVYREGGFSFSEKEKVEEEPFKGKCFL